LRDPRVQQNEAYLAVIVLARVVTCLGSLTEVHTGVIENLYASDLAYLQRLYEKFNGSDEVEPELAAEKQWAAGGKTLRRFTAVGEA
jgi:hypothetical protein